MSFVPNVRSKAQVPLYSGTRGSKVVGENNYYEGYLSDDDASYVAGYDWNTEMCVSNYFDNFDVYADDFENILGALGFSRDVFDHVLNADIDISALTESDIKKMSDVEKVEVLFSIFKSTLLQHVESERDEMIVSMLDSYDDVEFDKNKTAYINGYRNHVLVQNNKVFELADEDGNYYDEEVYDTVHTEMFPLINQDYEDDLNGYVVIGEDDDDDDDDLFGEFDEENAILLGSEPTDDVSLLLKSRETYDPEDYGFDDDRDDDYEPIGEEDCLSSFKKGCESIIDQLYQYDDMCEGCIFSDGCDHVNCPMKGAEDDE